MLETLAVYREGETGLRGGIMLDTEGNPIPLANIGLGTIELRDEATGAVVNGRDPSDPLTVAQWKFAENGVYVPGTHGITVGFPHGAISWDISAADTTIADP